MFNFIDFDLKTILICIQIYIITHYVQLTSRFHGDHNFTNNSVDFYDSCNEKKGIGNTEVVFSSNI